MTLIPSESGFAQIREIRVSTLRFLNTFCSEKAIRDEFQICFHRGLLKGMSVSGQSGTNPIGEFYCLTGQEFLQVGCNRIDHGTTVDGDLRIQSSVKPTHGQPGETEVRMNSVPKKPDQHRVQDDGSSSERTMNPPIRIGCLSDCKLEFLFNAPPGNESGWSGPCSGTVEPGPNRVQ